MEDKVLNDLYVQRKLLESSEGSYIDFKNTEITYTTALRFDKMFYQR